MDSRHTLNHKGLEVYSPTQFVTVKTIDFDYKMSDSEVRKSKLVYKLKRRKAILNMVLKCGLTILISLITSSFWLIILSIFNNILTGIEIGIAIPMTWIATYAILDSIFETEISWVKVKHKGRIYY